MALIFSWRAIIYLLFGLPFNLKPISFLNVHCLIDYKSLRKTLICISGRKVKIRLGKDKRTKQKELCLQTNKLNYSKRNFLYQVKSPIKTKDLICRIYDLFLFSLRGFREHWFIILLELFCKTIWKFPHDWLQLLNLFLIMFWY